MKRTTALLLSVGLASTILASGIVVAATDVMATSSSKSVCVNKETKVLKLRKNCRATERYMGSADVLKNGGESAYETWLGLGNRGSEQDFINSLRGSNGSSGASSTTNPFDGMTCAGATAFAEQFLHRSKVYKSNWDYIEQQTGCDLDSTQVVNYTHSPEFNDVLSSYDLSVTGPAEVINTNRGYGSYEVPIVVDFELVLTNGWVVCDSSIPVYGNSGWATSGRFNYWDSLEEDKVTENSYSVQMSAVIYRDGLYFQGADLDDEFYVPVCKPDETNTFGWAYQTIFPLPIYNPGEFRGLDVPYISEWGWE